MKNIKGIGNHIGQIRFQVDCKQFTNRPKIIIGQYRRNYLE